MTKPLRILHLEDDPLDAELVKSALAEEKIPFEIVRVATHDDFVAALECGGFDMIFADYSLPSFDGLSALEISKGKCPDVPFIFVTGKMGEELAIDTLKSGATDYVLKHRPSRLGPSVRRALGEVEERLKLRQAEEELRQYQEHLEELVRERTAELEKVNEQLQAAYKDMESFSYSASHDLRSPLITIDGFARLLEEDYAGRLDDEGRRFIGVIRENSKKMWQLIEDILSFSRVSTKEVQKEKINMESLARQVLGEMKNELDGKNMKVEMKTLPQALGDLPMIRQVFVNLLSNAVKYTPANKASVIEIGGQGSRDENVYYVKDSGVGFPMESADKLFLLFQRLHNQKQFMGTGVGLAIVKRIVEKHNGRVWAEGKVNEGATFYFSLPRS
jgi:signal transduction histidine kinase